MKIEIYQCKIYIKLNVSKLLELNKEYIIKPFF